MGASEDGLPQGVGIELTHGAVPAKEQAALRQWAAALGLAGLGDLHLDTRGPRSRLDWRLAPGPFDALCAGFDTLELPTRLAGLPAPTGVDALLRETAVAVLAAPRRLSFDSVADLQAHLRVRCHIARAAQKTALAFQTRAAERPAEYWHYDEDHGFLLRQGADLITALRAATQPEATGRLYDFSCYRATEYVILLGIAEEARAHAPSLYAELQAVSQRTCIKSGRFHDTFLIEYGAVEAPVPMRYYVPGDRVWFKNPDEPSADVEGYEGSWVIYLGGGLFSNFWRRDDPYTLDHKALEIFHWRHATYRDAQACLRMDEAIVSEQVRRSLSQPDERRRIVARMTRYRDPAGVYAQGGCIDASREFPLPLSRLRLP